jgi:hypothetical protein
MPVNVGDLPCECVLQILSHQPVPISLESAPLAPASNAWAAAVLSRFAVNTRVGMWLPTPPSLISPTRSSPLPSERSFPKTAS